MYYHQQTVVKRLILLPEKAPLMIIFKTVYNNSNNNNTATDNRGKKVTAVIVDNSIKQIFFQHMVKKGHNNSIFIKKFTYTNTRKSKQNKAKPKVMLKIVSFEPPIREEKVLMSFRLNNALVTDSKH